MSTTKPSLVLLSGMLCDRGAWTDLIAGLEGAAVCSVPDYGLAASITEMAERVLADAPPRFSLAGHSMGGRVAMEICRLAPERLDRLCLIATEHLPQPSGAAGQMESKYRGALLDFAKAHGMHALGLRWMPTVVHPAITDTSPLSGAFVAMIERQSPEKLERQIEAGAGRPDSTAELAAFPGATLILCGREDGLRPPEAHLAMARLVPDSRLVMYANCGHMLPMEKPAEAAADMRRWLALS
ncbi:MAG: alpha/beta hydrolase [Pseudomonadota bacterium]